MSKSNVRVRVRFEDSLDDAIKRFNRKCADAGIMQEMASHSHYRKPSSKRREKTAAAETRRLKEGDNGD